MVNNNTTELATTKNVSFSNNLIRTCRLEQRNLSKRFVWLKKKKKMIAKHKKFNFLIVTWEMQGGNWESLKKKKKKAVGISTRD